MEFLGWSLVGLLVLFFAVCLGRIAGKLGRNPWLFGALALVSPLNLIALGYLAFSPKVAGPGEVGP